ncbi:hypothetical protein HQ50_08945 [Porphyromonas sp. COT-052 OH4946]|uniref:Uncharacterized protein n=1 Tax=Porphyromonas gulae TaxID=111105 RepID=A0A0A2FF08_9PORP|nr:hypothetical protein HQ50_08945 [Porphyromonas sp. COT-052 OH4946]KGN86924.1 hypothetical protein HR08_02885 [Porphyromonas gulae]
MKETRTKNAPIVVRVFRKNGARFFSFWRENFSLLAPKQKSLRAAFCGTISEIISAREPTGIEIKRPAIRGKFVPEDGNAC